MSADGQSAKVELGAALFNGDHTQLAAEVARLEAGGIDYLHLDVFDGSLVPDLAFPPRTIAALRTLTQLRFDVHLVTQAPDRYLDALADAGVDRVFFHVEGALMAYETTFAIQERGMTPGVAVALGTPIESITGALAHVDAVLLLSRLTGEGSRGATFHPAALPRITHARRSVAAERVRVEIQVAGGINRCNAGDVVLAGADSLALGAGIFRADDLAAEVKAVREAVRSATPQL